MEHCVFRWRKAPVSIDHLKPASRHLDFAEQRVESYNEIISEIRIKGRSSHSILGNRTNDRY
jgi:hypothetical protein